MQLREREDHSYQHSDMSATEIKGDRSAELGGGPCKEDLFDIFRDLINGNSRGQCIPVNYSYS